MFKHPNDVCLSYWEHMKISFYLSYTFFIGSFYAFIHGIYPDIFITNSSDMIRDVSIEMKKIGCRKNEN